MRGLLGGVGFGTTELTVVRPYPQQSSSEYLYWLFMSAPFRKLGEASMYGAGGQKRVPDDFIRDFVVAFPDLAEQGAIVAFLDRETGKIDELVAEQEKLTALLKEKRQAVISHAVTKGLNPEAPMKPSGIEWLGDVPAHWTVMPIRLAAKLESGHTPSRNHPEYWENCEVPWFTLADVWQIREQGVEYVYDTKEKVSELGLANSSARLLPKGTEPPRLSRRLLHLRRWSHDESNEVFPGGPGACSPDGIGACGGVRITVGGDGVDCGQDRMYS
jgi:type I restriction enzyme S subunit